MSEQRYEPLWDQSKYRKVPAKPLRAKPETFKSCGKRDPEWKIPSKIDITVEVDANKPPTIGEIVGTVDWSMPAILEEREQQRLKWEAERAEAAQPKTQPETKPAESPAPKSWLRRVRDWLKSFPS